MARLAFKSCALTSAGGGIGELDLERFAILTLPNSGERFTIRVNYIQSPNFVGRHL